MSDSKAPAAEAPRPKYHRSAKNYLLDRPFQLKYTGYLVGIASVLSVVLGLIVGYTSKQARDQSDAAVRQGQETVKQGESTVSRGKEVIEQSRKVSKVVQMNIAERYSDDPELAKTFKEDADKDEEKLRDQQKSLERDAETLVRNKAELEKQAERIESQHRLMLVVLVASLLLLVAFIGVAGIVVTHKVAGPIFKMKRLLRQVGEGKLLVKEKLRKGDELHHFFETFEAMVHDLNAQQRKHIAALDEAIDRIDENSPTYRATGEIGVAKLKELRAKMLAQVDG